MKYIFCIPMALHVWLILLSGPTSAAKLQVCNRSDKVVYTSIGDENDSKWRASGFYEISPANCQTIGPDNLSRRFFFQLRFKDSEGAVLASVGNEQTGWKPFCVPASMDTSYVVPQSLIDNCKEMDGYSYAAFLALDRGESNNCNVVIKSDLQLQQECLTFVTVNKVINLKVGEIYNKCMASWPDSQQVHSVETIVRLDYQAIKTTMKQLKHCIRLKAVGPIDIESIVKSHIDNCIHNAIDSEKNKGIITLIAGLVADFFGAGGAATTAAVADYISNVSDDAMKCLKDTDKLQASLSDALKKQFSATIQHEQEWEYWQL